MYGIFLKLSKLIEGSCLGCGWLSGYLFVFLVFPSYFDWSSGPWQKTLSVISQVQDFNICVSPWFTQTAVVCAWALQADFPSNILCGVRWSMVDWAKPFANPGSSFCWPHWNYLIMVEIPPNSNWHLFKLSSSALRVGGIGGESVMTSPRTFMISMGKGDVRTRCLRGLSQQ